MLACPASMGTSGLGSLACVTEVSGKSGFSEGPFDAESLDRVAGAAQAAASRRAVVGLAC